MRIALRVEFRWYFGADGRRAELPRQPGISGVGFVVNLVPNLQDFKGDGDPWDAE